MTTINEQIRELQLTVLTLNSRIKDLEEQIQKGDTLPYSREGKLDTKGRNRPIDIRTGLGALYGGNFIWNDAELVLPPFGTQPVTPTKGYNKHGHSQYSGGAFDIRTIEFVEYETNESGSIIDANGNVLNKHCQQYWSALPNIEEAESIENGNSEFVPKIGGITDSMVFDVTDSQWKFYAVYAEEEE